MHLVGLPYAINELLACCSDNAMDNIFRGIIESQHPAVVKRATTESVVIAQSMETPPAVCARLMNYSLELAADSEKNLNKDLAARVFVSYSRDHPEILSEVLVPSLVENLLTSPDHCNRVLVLHILSQCLSLMSNSKSQLTIQRIVRLHCIDMLRDNYNLDMAKAFAHFFVKNPEFMLAQNQHVPFMSLLVTIVMKVDELRSGVIKGWTKNPLVFDVHLIAQLFKQIWAKLPSDGQMAILSTIFGTVLEGSSIALGAFISHVSTNIIQEAIPHLLMVNRNQLLAFLNCLVDGVEWPIAVGENVAWVTHFFTELAARNSEIVINALEKNMDHIFAICLRSSDPIATFELLKYSLLTCQNSKATFHSIAIKIPDMVAVIHDKLNSDEKRLNFKYDVAKVMQALIRLHPGHPGLYNPVETCLRGTPSVRNELLDNLLKSHQHPPPTPSEPNSTMVPVAESRSITGKVGLVNQGNTCYVNCILQALFMTYKFTVSILKSKPKNEQLLLKKLQEVFGFLTHSKRASVRINEFCSVSRPPWSDSNRQHDCSEYLRHLLDTLHEQERKSLDPKRENAPGADSSLPTASSATSLTTGRREAVSDEEMDNLSEEEMQEETENDCSKENSVVLPKTLIEQAFAGKMITTYRCLSCGTVSERPESFIDLHLTFPSNANEGGTKVGKYTSTSNSLSLEDMLRLYFTPETLEGDNSYKCEKCKQLTRAERTTRIVSAPEFLVLTLLRFSYNPGTNEHSKIFTEVQYPLVLDFPDTANAAGDSSPPKKPATCFEDGEVQKQSFTLYAVVIHSGISVESGHYYTYCRSSLPTQVTEMNDDQMEVPESAQCSWFKFNDSSVTNATYDSLCSLTKVSSKETAYILFYQRVPDNLTDSPGSAVQDVSVPDPKFVVLPPFIQAKIDADNRQFKEEESKNVSRTACFSPVSKRHDDDNPPGSCGGGGGFQSFSNHLVF